MNSTTNQFPIDAVITWVDGTDPSFLKRKSKYADQSNMESINPTRFNEVGELNFVVKSIFKYAPFIRNIVILTDAQTPEIINASKNWSKYYQNKIQLVDHKEVFRDHIDVLPTFNILSIEAMLYKIKGLSEHFIYFNDDVFLIKPTTIEDWFVDGLPVIRGKWEPLPHRLWYKKIDYWFNPSKLKRFGYKRLQAYAAQLAGYTKRYFRMYHHPRALLKSQFETYFDHQPHLLKKQISYRFRSPEQFNPYGLILHASLLNKQAITSSKLQLSEVTYSLKKNPKRVYRKLVKAAADSTILFLNLQSLDLLEASELHKVINELDVLTQIDLTATPTNV